MPAPRHIRKDEDQDVYDDIESDADTWTAGYHNGKEEIVDNVTIILGPYAPKYGATELSVMEALEALVGRMIGLEK